MKIETVSIEKIIPYARNPRNNEHAVAKVAGSIKEFGWQQPIGCGGCAIFPGDVIVADDDGAVVIPQAMRVILPPLTNQYLNLTKNSSLAVFVGYPDLVQVFAGTVLNQTGAAVQVIAITMGVYLVISLVTSALMDIYNRRSAARER